MGRVSSSAPYAQPYTYAQGHWQIIARLRSVASTASPGIQVLLATDATWSGRKPAGASLIASHATQNLSDLILEMRG